MTLLEQLTKRQLAVFEFIHDKIQNRGYGPTVREIGNRFNISSPNGVMCHLRALERKGLISREPNMSRAIQLAPEFGKTEGMPLLGQVAAGVMHEAIEQSDSVDFQEMFTQQGRFALRVSGNSMIDAQIADGDYVIVERADTASAGQMVVARTDDGEATLKYWHPEKGRVRLQPANSDMDPIYVKNAAVVGVVVGVVRQY
ncbi:MAG: transcriptional repressor LexA [Planctomycetales bacterium]|nr:transcriptional repressor LexA [Planctomycetales bacterium]